MTMKEAVQKWVGEFNMIPKAVIEKAYGDDSGYVDLDEITPFSRGDKVEVYGDSSPLKGSGEIVGPAIVKEDELDDEGVTIAEAGDVIEDTYIVQFYDGSGTCEVHKDDMEFSYHDFWPMWGTMWTFGDHCDDYWLENLDGLQKMADCGLRIYESDELGYFFGIDGAGYDFYEEHWIPLYKARGLKWHDEGGETL